MSACPKSLDCPFFTSVEPSLVKRIRFASAFPYCNAGRHQQCALFAFMERGEVIPAGLLPDGGTGDYADRSGATEGALSRARNVLIVVDDSPVFATIAANACRLSFPDCEVVQCHSYDEAERHLRSPAVRLVVSGNGLGGGKTVHDVRRMSAAPIVLFTGRPDVADVPSNSTVVAKDAGPEALKAAMRRMLADA